MSLGALSFFVFSFRVLCKIWLHFNTKKILSNNKPKFFIDDIFYNKSIFSIKEMKSLKKKNLFSNAFFALFSSFLDKRRKESFNIFSYNIYVFHFWIFWFRIKTNNMFIYLSIYVVFCLFFSLFFFFFSFVF